MNIMNNMEMIVISYTIAGYKNQIPISKDFVISNKKYLSFIRKKRNEINNARRNMVKTA